jgi:hypothetical protein
MRLTGIAIKKAKRSMFVSKVLISNGPVVMLTGVPGFFGLTGPTPYQSQEGKTQGDFQGYSQGYPVTLGDQSLFCIKRMSKGIQRRNGLRPYQKVDGENEESKGD